MVSTTRQRSGSVRPPTEAESQMALQSSRRLGPAFAEVMRSARDERLPQAAEVIIQIKGHSEAKSVELPLAALRLFADILTEMARGNAVTLTPIHAELTTQQAADLLNVSRPYLCNLIDAGKIPHRKIGRHRRVRLAALLEYKERIDADRAQALDQLAAEAQELGLDD